MRVPSLHHSVDSSLSLAFDRQNQEQIQKTLRMLHALKLAMCTYPSALSVVHRFQLPRTTDLIIRAHLMGHLPTHLV